nr:DUF397 domain-containing protein [Streptomyces aidingensis]
MTVQDRRAVPWRKSSHSGTDENNECCEVALLGEAVLVRDSTRSGGPVLTFTPEMWRTALATLATRHGGGRP